MPRLFKNDFDEGYLLPPLWMSRFRHWGMLFHGTGAGLNKTIDGESQSPFRIKQARERLGILQPLRKRRRKTPAPSLRNAYVGHLDDVDLLWGGHRWR